MACVCTQQDNVTSQWSDDVPDAYVIVYSVADRDSLDHAVDLLRAMDNSDIGLVATILVANKGDMVRSRVVDEEGACRPACVYTELPAPATRLPVSLLSQ